MLDQHGNTFSTVLGGVIVCAVVVAVVRAAVRFHHGFEHGFGTQQKSDSQSVFSEKK